MIELDSVAGKALVAVTSGTTQPSSEAARVSARLFLDDVTHTIRWHAVVACVALAATPVVSQLARVVAHRHRADLVSLAKDAVQREELFNGAEADGVMIDPTDEGGITVSYDTLSRSQRRGTVDGQPLPSPPCTGGEAAGGGLASGSGSSSSAASGRTSSLSYASPSSTLALRLGRRHSWMVSSFARQVLAAQRATNVQFVRTCGWAAACQYAAVVLRACATSCALSVAAYAVTHACCNAADLVVPIASAGASGQGAAVPAGSWLASYPALHSLLAAPLFDTTAPPSASVGSTYGLFGFSASCSGVWSRLVPQLGVLQTLAQRLFPRLQPLHAEWRDTAPGVSSLFSPSATAAQTAANARADAVWAALTPRGYFVVTLLPRLPRRILSVLQWAAAKAADAAMRQWYERVQSGGGAGGGVAASVSPPPPSSSSPAATPPPALASSNSGGAHHDDDNNGGGGRRPGAAAARARRHRKLLDRPLARALSLFASDVTFAGVVFAATLYMSNGESRAFVQSQAGQRYNVYCWVEAVASVASVAVL